MAYFGSHAQARYGQCNLITPTLKQMFSLLLSGKGQIWTLCIKHNSDKDDQYPVKSVLTNSIKGFYANFIKTIKIRISKGMSRYSRYEGENKYDFALGDKKPG